MELAVYITTYLHQVVAMSAVPALPVCRSIQRFFKLSVILRRRHGIDVHPTRCEAVRREDLALGEAVGTAHRHWAVHWLDVRLLYQDFNNLHFSDCVTARAFRHRASIALSGARTYSHRSLSSSSASTSHARIFSSQMSKSGPPPMTVIYWVHVRNAQENRNQPSSRNADEHEHVNLRKRWKDQTNAHVVLI